MQISVVGAGSGFARLVADRLGGHGGVRRFDVATGSVSPGEHGVEVVDLLREADAAQCCRDADAVVHLAAAPALERGGTREAGRAGNAPPHGAPAVDALDAAARGTYNLFAAARAAGTERVVLASSLSFFDAYDPDYLVDEWWRPLPPTDPTELATYAAEEVARQYCLEGGIRCVALRFLPLGDDPERETRAEDAVGAIERALGLEFTVPGYRWRLFHVATARRFATRNAREHLGWEVHDG